MLTFPHSKITKANFLVDIQAHRDADRIVKGIYNTNGLKFTRGCAIGCSLESIRKRLRIKSTNWNWSNHADFERYLGIPQILARLEDRIFEGLSDTLALDWPLRFSSAVPEDVNLAMVWPRFALWLLSEEIPQHVQIDRGKSALTAVAELYRQWCAGTKPITEEWQKERIAATDAANAAEATFAAAADAAATGAVAADAVYGATAAAAAADAAADAATAATAADAATGATAAAAAADAAADAVYAAVAAAAAATGAGYAVYAATAADARQVCYIRMSDKLIEIIAACKDTAP